MHQKIRAWWTKRKKRRQEKYAEDHEWVTPPDLEEAQRNFEYRTNRQPRR